MLLEVQGADLRRSASGFRPRRIVSFYARVSLTFEKLKLHDISAPRPADRTWSVDGTGRIGVGIGVGIKRALLHKELLAHRELFLDSRLEVLCGFIRVVYHARRQIH